MKRRLGHVILILFAWLQCLSPLLHAHAAAEGHGGVHLPEWQTACAADEPRADWRNAHPVHSDQAIGVASSLEARQDGLPVDDTVLPGRRPAPNPALSLTRAPLRQPDWTLPHTTYLIPDACAPPRA